MCGIVQRVTHLPFGCIVHIGHLGIVGWMYSVLGDSDLPYCLERDIVIYLVARIHLRHKFICIRVATFGHCNVDFPKPHK